MRRWAVPVIRLAPYHRRCDSTQRRIIADVISPPRQRRPNRVHCRQGRQGSRQGRKGLHAAGENFVWVGGGGAGSALSSEFEGGDGTIATPDAVFEAGEDTSGSTEDTDGRDGSIAMQVLLEDASAVCGVARGLHLQRDGGGSRCPREEL